MEEERKEMTDNNALSDEQNLFKIMLVSFIQYENNRGYSNDVFWGIIRICYENYDRLEKRKDN